MRVPALLVTVHGLFLFPLLYPTLPYPICKVELQIEMFLASFVLVLFPFLLLIVDNKTLHLTLLSFSSAHCLVSRSLPCSATPIYSS